MLYPKAQSQTHPMTGSAVRAGGARRRRRLHRLGSAALGCVALIGCLALSGCSHHRNTPPNATAPAAVESQPEQPTGAVSEADERYVRHHEPIETLHGMASWYGPQFNHRRAANGQVYDENAITAANRTLPLNTLVRVTNERTGQSTLLYITDRGPFVPGRMLDLSRGAARATGVYRAGVAPVRMDVYRAPESLTEGGRWCVQIGAFAHTGKALKLKRQLERAYPDAQVIDFAGPTGHWVRIRPAGEERKTAESILRHTHPAEGNAYLVRLN